MQQGRSLALGGVADYVLDQLVAHTTALAS